MCQQHSSVDGGSADAGQCLLEVYDGGPPSRDGGGGPYDAVLVEGRPEMVSMTFLLPSGTCDTDASVTTLVLDAANASVPHQNTGLQWQPGIKYMRTEISAPLLAGDYRFIATLEPGLGRLERRVVVAVDRSGQPRKLVSGIVHGGHVDFTKRESLVRRAGNTVTVLRDGGVLLAVAGDIMAVHDDAIWTATSTTLTRVFDDGSSQFATASSPMPSRPLRLIADTDFVVVLWPDGARRYALDGGSLVQQESWQFDAGGADDLVGAYQAPYLIVMSSTGSCVTADGGTGLMLCTASHSQPIAFSADGIWTLGDRLRLHTAARSTTEGPRLPEGYSPWPVLEYGQQPIFSAGRYWINDHRVSLLFDGEWRFADWGEGVPFFATERWTVLHRVGTAEALVVQAR